MRLTVEANLVREWLQCEGQCAGEWVQCVLLRGCFQSLGRRGQWLHPEKLRRWWQRQKWWRSKPWACWWISRQRGIKSWVLAFDLKSLLYLDIVTHSVLKWKRREKKDSYTRPTLASFQKVSINKSPFQLRICCKIHWLMILVAGKYVNISARSNKTQVGICSFIFFWHI